MKEDATGRLLSVELEMGDWLIKAIENKNVLTLHRSYFQLRNPLERRLRAGLATAAEVEERFVQAHLGHASAEMTRRYRRRRDRFRVNLTQAAGL